LSGEPYFSVVIAAFNAAQWIVPTVRSALGQSYRGYEIIVVGDGCTDATGSILEAQFGDSVRWTNLDRNHGSQSFPNNEGIRLARGTHVAYLGHDDLWSPRHLEELARTIREADPDFAVSGAVYHGPPGSRYYQIAGLFDDPRTAQREFFPPSSFAHRRAVVGRIGPWREADALREPADCEFLLRAARTGCSFASTRTITVHKFAAGHRYLSYRFPSGLEQQRMLERLEAPGGESKVLAEIENDIAAGADHPPILYPDFRQVPSGEYFHRNRRIKGLEGPQAVAIDGPCTLPVESFVAGLDWHPLQIDRLRRPFRWSGPNPNPRHLVNARWNGRCLLRIHVLSFASAELAEALAIDADDRESAFSTTRHADGSRTLTIGPIEGPVDDGIVLRFRLPRCASLRRESGRIRAGLALSSVEVEPVP